MKHADGGYSIYVLLRFARVADDAGHRFILRRPCKEQKCAQHRYAQFISKPGTTIESEGYRFKVKEMDGHRIVAVEVEKTA
ncbi:hypothetical protein DT075_06795 [Bacillus licheniformis]|nr:hypothetical protein DT075_06795 [Bacillus licheniformis]